MPRPTVLDQKTTFERDTATTYEEKNMTLAKLLAEQWLGLAIVKIDRIEIGDRGWLATYRR